MATQGNLADMGLRQLLDGMQHLHNQDIATYASGHLNESKLWKPPETSTHKSWKSALKPNLTVAPPSAPPKKLDHHKSKQTERMRETLTNFSSARLTGPNTLNSNELSRDAAYIEEHRATDFKVEKTNKRPKGWTKENPLEPLKDKKFQNPPAVTKKDQYQAIKQFNDDFIYPSSTAQQKGNTGESIVGIIEDRLQRKLDTMPRHVARGTNFRRVQAFGSSFEELIENSPTFGYMLTTIKNEYDRYLSFLLDSQPGRHKRLRDHVAQLSSEGTCKPQQLKYEIEEVNKAELEAKALLEENDRLRQELEEEQELSRLPAKELESPQKLEPTTKEDKHSLVIDIEDLNTNVQDKLDEVKRIRQKLHQECVPAIVCNHLEQCVKDTEVETQRLISQKEFYISSISDTEDVLHKAIAYADTTEKDTRRIWEKLEVKQDSEGKLIIEDADDEIIEETKWNWYIS